MDWLIELSEAAKRMQGKVALQGNLDPAVLMAPLPELRMRINELLKRGASRLTLEPAPTA